MDITRFEGLAEKFAGIDYMALIIEHGALIYDILIGFIFLIVIFSFGKRGLIKSTTPVACIVLALATGISAANSFTEPITDRVYARMVAKVSEQISQALGSAGGSNLQEIISNGLPDSVSEAVGISTRAAVSHTVHIIILVAVTVVSFIIYHLLAKVLEGAADLPLIRIFDFLGGMILGLAFCILFFYIIVHVFRRSGIDLFDNISDGTIMIKWFTDVKL